MNSLEQYKNLIEDSLSKYSSGSKPENLHEPIRYILGLGGKRIRPILVLMGYGVFNDHVERALHQAMAIELFHNFTLIHDDIMDRADLRRGRLTVHKKWSEPTAILSGDLMLIKAYELLCDAPAHMLPPLLQAFNTMATEVCEGQQLDMDFEKRTDVSEEEYIEMIRKKTSVLIGAALQIGALRAGADVSEAGLLYEFGVNIGLAFQMLDDYLDVFGQPEKTGKVEGGDVLNGKKTLLFLHCYRLADEQSKRELLSIYENRLSKSDDEKVRTARELFKATGSDTYLYKKAEDFYHIGVNLLKSAELPRERIKPLLLLAEYLMQRQH